MNKNLLKKFSKTILFLLLLSMVFFYVQRPFKTENPRFHQLVTGFYTEREGTLDAVFVGASSTYTFWSAPIGWRDYGITSYSYAVPNMPSAAIKYVIEEARKTQPDALYVITLNSFKEKELPEEHFHFITDFFPFSSTKVKMISEIAPGLKKGRLGMLEYFFPIIRFHSRWSELQTTDYIRKLERMKGGSHYSAFMNRRKDLSKDYSEYNGREAMLSQQKEGLTALLDYCDHNKVRVLFVVNPQVIPSDESKGQLNEMADFIRERGYDVYNCLNDVDKIGLDLRTDYYDEKHTNVYGALKCTNYVGRYLVENYSFTDKRGDAAYAEWDDAAEMYVQVIGTRALDFEIEHDERDLQLQAPKIFDIEATSEAMVISWETVDNADHYAIYRRVGDEEPYKRIATLEASEKKYEDVETADAGTYTYTVVPIRTQNGREVYGVYDMKGKTGNR